MIAAARKIALGLISLARRIVVIAVMATIAGIVILFFLQYPHSPKVDELQAIIQLRKYGDRLFGYAFSWLKLTWPPARDTWTFWVSGGAALLAVWGVKLAIDWVFNRGNRLVSSLFPAAKLSVATVVGAQGLPGFETDAPIADTEQARDELLKRYREIEKQLKSARRKRCTFLAVDVVGSTQMKLGEQETQIAATFQAYEEMLRKIFDQYGAWKQAWTPDGVMICFLDRELAIAAGQRILRSLKKFNENDNKLRTPFSVRCGLNEGEVPIYEDSRLEKIADHVIDVAGHMQKQGTPDTLWVPAETYASLANKSGFEPLETVVDGYQVYEWRPSAG